MQQFKLKQGQGPGVGSIPDPGLTELQVKPPFKKHQGAPEVLPGQLAVHGAGEGAALNPPGPDSSHAEPGSAPASARIRGEGSSGGWDCAIPVWSSEKPRQRKGRASLTLHRTEQVTASPRRGCCSAFSSVLQVQSNYIKLNLLFHLPPGTHSPAADTAMQHSQSAATG